MIDMTSLLSRYKASLKVRRTILLPHLKTLFFKLREGLKFLRNW